MITRVAIQGFRGISGTQVFTLENLTILTGRNGLGKTTFFDAVDWCLFGPASRLGSQPELIRNLYHSENHTSVELDVTLWGDTVTVVRTEDEVTLNGMPVNERELAETFIGDPDVFPPYLRELGKQVRTVTYLPQEQMRDFVNASLSSERRALLRGLLGVPNAGIVESSTKRVRDHFSAREKILIEEIDNFGSEIAQLATGVEFDPTVDRDVREFLALFREQYGDRSNKIENLRSALEGDLATAEHNAAMVDTVLAAQSETATILEQSDKEITVHQQRRSELGQRAAAISVQVNELAVSIDAAQRALEDSTREIRVEEDRVARLSTILSSKQRLEQLTQELARWNGEREDLAARRTASAKSAETLRIELEAANNLADEYRLQVKLSRERAEVELRHADLGKRLSRRQEDRRQQETDLTEAERAREETSIEIATAKADQEEASATHELAVRSAHREANIADLRNKLIEMIGDTDSQCPLCGAQYGTHDRLLEHLTARGGTSDVDDQLQNASSTLNAAGIRLTEAEARKRRLSIAVDQKRTTLDQLNRDIVQLSAEYEDVGLSLQKLAKPSDVTISADVLTKVDEGRAKAELLDQSFSQLDYDLQSVEGKRSKTSAEIEGLQAAGILSVASNVTAETVTRAQEALYQGKKSLEERQQAIRRFRDSQEAEQSRLSDTRSEIAATEGRSKAELDRKRRVMEEFDRQCELVGLTGMDIQRVGDELLGRANRLQAEIAECRSAISRAKAIERRQIINESVTKQREFQRRLAEVQEHLSVLRQAQNRFHEIAEALVETSRMEAESAGTLHLAAIQKCVNDLYPHRHLNEVEIDFAEGELLVTDRWLTKGVRPQDYSSTGQANVLALSVFLGLAVRQTFSSARFLLLDEPVQNLDDLHFLAFLTLLKRVALSRQVIISTADSNITEILRRQLSSWSVSNRSWCEYEWEAFRPESGPTIRRREGRKIAAA
jgi:DNA repair exonuclease SbcCD ATPase subunit